MPRTPTLAKTRRITVRFTPEQAERIEHAARLKSAHEGEIVDPSTLIRDLVLPRVARLLTVLDRRAA